MKKHEIDNVVQQLKEELVGFKFPKELFIDDMTIPFSDCVICGLIDKVVTIWLNKHNLKSSWLELKSFTGIPNFDIGAFRSYINEIIDHPWKLHAKYLLIKYKIEENGGLVVIEDFWLKNVWEIACTSTAWPLKVQCKRGVINNIRPATWYSERSDFRPFDCLEDFLAALEQTIYKYHDTNNLADHWSERLCDSYFKYYGKKLNLPRWMDVKHKYIEE